MQARISDIKRFAVHDGDGIRTTVFFKGCSLRCLWCHNPEGLDPAPQLAYTETKCLHCGECTTVCPTGAQQMTEEGHLFRRETCRGCGKCASVCLGSALTYYGRTVTVDELLPLLLEDREFYEGGEGYANVRGGVTLSGGECLLQAEFCAELLQRLQAEGIHTAVDTCGYVPWEKFERVLPYTDVFLYDLKAYDEAVHIRCTGHSNRRILENLQTLDAQGKATEIRIPYVPGYNDHEMEKLAAFVATLQHVVRVRVLPYHKYAGSKYAALGMKNTLPEILPTQTEIEAAQSLFSER